MEQDPSAARFLRICGGALILGGALAALLNLILTPLVPAGGDSIASLTSTALGLRLPLAALSAMLTTAGCVGLYLAQAKKLRFGSLAFLLAIVGGFLTVWVELVQATLVRDLAFRVPEVLERLENEHLLSRYDRLFVIAVACFALGWLAVALVSLRTGVLRRRAPLTLLVGLFLVPILGGLIPGVWGAVAGNVVL